MKRKLPLLLILLSTFLFLTSNLYAQQEAATGDRRLSISGTSDEAGNLSINFQGDPGQTLTGTTTITNLSADQLKIITEFQDYIVEGESGVPVSVEAGSSVWSMSLWASVPSEFQEFTLEPNEAKEVPFTIDIPQDATPGGHYAMILFTPALVQEEVIGPLIEHKVGNLMKLNVSGDVQENAEITEFSAPYFSEYGPIPLTLRVLNTGNTHVQTAGSITIKNMVNRKVASWELKNANVFPTAVRAWDTEWPGKWRFGLYKAEASLTYGSQNTPLYAQVYFWVIPWKILIGVIVVIVILLLLGRTQESKKVKSKKKKKTAENNLKSEKEEK